CSFVLLFCSLSVPLVFSLPVYFCYPEPASSALYPLALHDALPISTGAGSNLIDHVSTQLPYALMSAGVATLGYVVLGVTGSVWVGLAAVMTTLVVLFTIWILRDRKQ